MVGLAPKCDSACALRSFDLNEPTVFGLCIMPLCTCCEEFKIIAVLSQHLA